MEQEKITIVTPQFDRTEELDFQHVPANEQEFLSLVNNAPTEILKGFGFGKWDSINNIIRERQGKKPLGKVTMPVFEMDEIADVLSGDIVKAENMVEFDLTPKHESTTELLEEDEDILLFPAEWYNLIPNGFMVTGLYGESYPFEKGKTDNDRRFGCLAYGIRRKFTPKPTPNEQ